MRVSLMEHPLESAPVMNLRGWLVEVVVVGLWWSAMVGGEWRLESKKGNEIVA